jgi:predicted membrane protein
MGLLTLFLLTFLFLAVIIILMAFNPFVKKKGSHAKDEQSQINKPFLTKQKHLRNHHD